MREKDPVRKGMFTTGLLSTTADHNIAPFFTGRNHAGEYLEDLLKQRGDRSPPIQMCDALARNIPKNLKTLLSNCLVHSRRGFVDVMDSFPEEYRHVIEALASVYQNDHIPKEQNMNPHERLRFHQDKSGPLMTDLHTWLDTQLKKSVEPNSGLGQAIAYMLNHGEALTLFLREPGAPLINNICERP